MSGGLNSGGGATETILGTSFYGCADKAAPGYAQCVQLDIQTS